MLISIQWLGFQGSTLALAALLSLCAIPALVWNEPGQCAGERLPQKASLWATFQRRHFSALLAFAVLYSAAHSANAALVRLYLIDKSWTLSSVGTIDTIGMLAMIVVSCGIASWLVSQLTIARSLVTGMLLVFMSSCAWFVCAWYGTQPSFAFAAIFQILDNIGIGLASVAAFTAFMQFAGQGDQTGTDVAIFKSANVFGEIGAASAATAIAAGSGNGVAFVFSVLLCGAVILMSLATGPLFSQSGSKNLGEHDESSLPEGDRRPTA